MKAILFFLISLQFALVSIGQNTISSTDSIQIIVENINNSLDQLSSRNPRSDEEWIDGEEITSELLVLLNKKEIANYDLNELLNLEITQSKDSNVSILSFFENTGGSYQSHTNILYQRMNFYGEIKPSAKIIIDKSREFSDRFGGTFHEIHTIDTKDDPIYLALASGVGCNTCTFDAAYAFRSGKETDLLPIFEYHQDYRMGEGGLNFDKQTLELQFYYADLIGNGDAYSSIQDELRCDSIEGVCHCSGYFKYDKKIENFQFVKDELEAWYNGLSRDAIPDSCFVKQVTFNPYKYLIQYQNESYRLSFLELTSEKDSLNKIVNEMISSWVREQLPPDYKFPGFVNHHDTLPNFSKGLSNFQSNSYYSIEYDEPHFLSFNLELSGNIDRGHRPHNWESTLVINLDRRNNEIVKIDSIISPKKQLELHNFLLQSEYYSNELEDYHSLLRKDTSMFKSSSIHDNLNYKGFIPYDKGIKFLFTKRIAGNVVIDWFMINLDDIAPFLNHKYQWMSKTQHYSR